MSAYSDLSTHPSTVGRYRSMQVVEVQTKTTFVSVISSHDSRYLNLLEKVQRDPARWRSTQFSRIERQFPPGDKDALIGDISQRIFEELLDDFSVLRKSQHDLPAEFLKDDMPPMFFERIWKITEDAYAWNTAAKRDVLDYNLEPFVFHPQAPCVAIEMEPFEKAIDIKKHERIISSVSLGLKVSATLATGTLSNVQEKAKVLVEAYFPPPQAPVKGDPNRPEGGAGAGKEDGPARGGGTGMNSGGGGAGGGAGGNGADIPPDSTRQC